MEAPRKFIIAVLSIRNLGYVDDTLSNWAHGLENPHRFLEHINSLHPSIKLTLEMQKEDKTIPLLDVLLIIQEDGSLGHKMYRKPTHTERYLHYNSFHHHSLKNSACKTLINRAKTIVEVDNIKGELEHLRSVSKMNAYPNKFITQHVRKKTEYQSSVSLPYIGFASHKIERILKETGIFFINSIFLISNCIFPIVLYLKTPRWYWLRIYNFFWNI